MRCGCSGQAAQEEELAGSLGDDALRVGVEMEDFFCGQGNVGRDGQRLGQGKWVKFGAEIVGGSGVLVENLPAMID